MDRALVESQMTLHAKQLFFIRLCGSKNIHTPNPHPPPPPMEDHWKFQGGGGSKAINISKGQTDTRETTFSTHKNIPMYVVLEPMQHSETDSENGKQNYYISRNRKQALRKSKIKSTAPSACFALLEWFSCIDDKLHFLFATEGRSPCFHDKLHEIKGFAHCNNRQTCEWTLFSE